MMRQLRYLLSLAALLVAGPTLAASVTATTGWVCAGDAQPNGTLTIDAGSNRKLLITHTRENNTDPAPTITVGGQSATESFVRFYDVSATPDQWVYAWIWNASAITAMSGSAVSFGGATQTFARGWCYGTVENTDQAALGAYDDTDVTSSATSLASTTTSSSGDLIVAAAVMDNAASTFTSWDTLSEVSDVDHDGGRMGFAAGNGGDATTTVTISAGDDWTLVSLVFANLAAPTATVALAKDSSTTTTIVFDVTFDQTVSFYWAAYNKDEAANVPANCAAIQTATGALSSDDNAQTATASVEKQFTVTVTAPLRVIDLYACGSNGNGSTAALSVLDAVRTTLTGYATIADTGADGVDALSPLTPYTATVNTTNGSRTLSALSQDDRFFAGELLDLGNGTGFPDDGPTVIESVNYAADTMVIGDAATSNQTGAPTISNLVNELGSALISPALGTSNWGIEYELGTETVDCDADDLAGDACVSWDEDALAIIHTLTGAETAYRCYTIYLQHYGNGTGLFAAPMNIAHKVCVNNDPPTADAAPLDRRVFAPMTDEGTIDIGAAISDVNGGTNVCYLRSALPADATYSSSTGIITLTAGFAAEDEDGFTLVFLCRDEGYSWVQWQIIWFSIDTWTAPDVVGDTDIPAAQEELAPPHRLADEVTVIEACDDAPEGEIFAQAPTAMSEAAADAVLSISVSTGSCATGEGGGADILINILRRR
jgi:hypothetical protein